MTEWLERDIIITGERVSNAAASFDQNGQPNVQITLDGEGGMLMSCDAREREAAHGCSLHRTKVPHALRD